MQAIRLNADTFPGPVYNRTDRKQHSKRCRQGKTDNGTERYHYSFLKMPISPIESLYRTETLDVGDYNYFTNENYEYLLGTARNYASLMEKRLKHRPAKSIGVSIANLYEELDSIIGDVDLNIEPFGDQLRFVLWKNHQWENYTFYWLPVKFTESLNPKLRKVALSFVHEFMHSNGIYPLHESFEIDWVLEWAEENLYEIDPLKRRKYRHTINSYKEGRIFNLLKRIYTGTYYKNLPDAINRYIPKNGFEKELVNSLMKGLQFIGQDKPSIMSYAYDPYYDEEQDFQPVEMERIIRVIYDQDDFVTKELMEFVNAELRESYDISPATVFYLSPNTAELFSMNDYPERFYKWFNEFCNLTNI